MLNLSAQNVRLNSEAKDKQQAIHLVAKGLVENGHVAVGYEEGMLMRETQTSTFLGNGIAIPHGTLDTRDLVQKTGVQVYQFPNGVEWGDGNIAYVVIGIAAKSDEHLNLLRQLTSILGDEQIAEILAKTTDLDQFITLLSGKSALPIISTELISQNQDTDSLLTLSAINAAKLQEKGYVNQLFISDVVANSPLALGNELYLADSNQGNLANGIALVRGQSKTLITIATTDDSLQSYFAQLLKPEFRQQLSTMPLADLLVLFTGKEEDPSTSETVADELEAILIIQNEHGLHARPGAVLVNEVKKYNATVQVQNLDRQTSLVSAKSLMKIVALGAQKGHQLRFVATGEQAQQALDGIAKVIAVGLGE